MSTLDLFLPLAKVDLDRRIVHGIVTAETPDRVGEICDYDTTKPYFEAWSAEAQAASGGKSLGAVRAMHGRIAAGKLTDISFDDEGKRIFVAAKIVDDEEWRKVSEGVYTGFSQGGRYVKRWTDPETTLTRYTAEPSEISLVDLPCLPDATFEVVKDGVVEKRAFAAVARKATPEAAVVAAAPSETAAKHVEAESLVEGPRPTEPHSTVISKDAAARTEALEKAANALSQAADRLERAVEENSRLRKTLADFEPAVIALEKRLAAIEAQPYPAKAALRALPRSADFGPEDAPVGIESAIKRLSSLPDEERALALMKVSLANPLKQRL